MRSICLWRAVALFAAVFVLAGAFAQAQCKVRPGQQVSLYGGVDDPDVLVWDSRARLVQFSDGSSDARRFLLPHAILVPPGTNAKVEECHAGEVREKFSFNKDDAIGIMIVSGPFHGRYGWVTQSDLRGSGISESADQW